VHLPRSFAGGRGWALTIPLRTALQRRQLPLTPSSPPRQLALSYQRATGRQRQRAVERVRCRHQSTSDRSTSLRPRRNVNKRRRRKRKIWQLRGGSAGPPSSERNGSRLSAWRRHTDKVGSTWAFLPVDWLHGKKHRKTRRAQVCRKRDDCTNKQTSTNTDLSLTQLSWSVCRYWRLAMPRYCKRL